jgi:hypothetical protein
MSNEAAERTVEERIAAVLRFARFSGPTGDIDQILAEIGPWAIEPSGSESEPSEEPR